MRFDLNPLATPGDHRQDSASRSNDPHVMLELGHIFFRGRLPGERPRQHELALEHIATLDPTIEGRRHPPEGRMADPLLNVRDDPSGIGLVPASVEPSVARPSWTTRLPERSCGSTSPRFSYKFDRITRRHDSDCVVLVAEKIRFHPRREPGRADLRHPACMGLSLSREHHAIFVVLCHSILLFDPRREHSSVSTAYFHHRRAQRRSRTVLLQSAEGLSLTDVSTAAGSPAIGWLAAR